MAFAFILLLFPTGRLRSRRWRPAAWFVAAAFTLYTAAAVVRACHVWADPFTPLSNGWYPGSHTAIVIAVPAALLVSAAAVVVRFAGSSSTLKVVFCLTVVCLFAAIAVAILKYRLYDIDRVISRTLAYAIVTGVLAGVHAGLVLLATQVFRAHAPVAVAAATLAAAALFSPVRRRVQRRVDRRFNRARYEAEQTVAAFAARLKDAVDLDTVREDLARVIEAAPEPAHVSMWTSLRE